MICAQMVPLYYEGIRLTVPEMKERFNVNPRTITPALTRLVRAGVLNSKTGGTERGYIFASDPKNVTVYDITTIIQGDFKMRCCRDVIGDEKACLVSKGGSCQVLEKMNAALQGVISELKSVTLYDQYACNK